jgi:ankyrin repeat protein
MNRIDEELHSAARENDLPEARRLLSVGANVNAKDTDGATPLAVTNNLGMTPLIIASMMGHSLVVKEFLVHGAYIESKDNNLMTPLHWACLEGYLAVVIELLSPGDEMHGNDSNAATSQRTEMEVKNRDGGTPLHLACFGGHLAIVKVLMSRGADILAADNQELLPIHLAVAKGKSTVAKYILQEFYATMRPLPLHELLKDLTWIPNPNSDIPHILRFALARNVLGTDDVVDILDYLVGQNPAWLCSRDQDGSLPVHVASHCGVSFNIVQSLVNHDKASVKSVTSGGDLPLFLACEAHATSLDTIFLLMKLYPDLL